MHQSPAGIRVCFKQPGVPGNCVGHQQKIPEKRESPAKEADFDRTVFQCIILINFNSRFTSILVFLMFFGRIKTDYQRIVIIANRYDHYINQLRCIAQSPDWIPYLMLGCACVKKIIFNQFAVLKWFSQLVEFHTDMGQPVKNRALASTGLMVDPRRLR